jgi:hypothetical protein
VAESTVAKYRVRNPKPSSQTWKTFLENHAGEIISIDFFTVPTITFRILFCFVVLRHDRRQVVHFNVTSHPTVFWTGQQMVQAFPEDTAPRYLLRDQDQIYGADFTERVRALGIQEVRAAPGSPWQRALVERLIGSIWIAPYSGRLSISKTSCLSSGVISTGIAHITHWRGEHQIRTRRGRDRSQISTPTDGNLTVEACIRHRSLRDSPKTLLSVVLGQFGKATRPETVRCVNH